MLVVWPARLLSWLTVDYLLERDVGWQGKEARRQGGARNYLGDWTVIDFTVTSSSESEPEEESD